MLFTYRAVEFRQIGVVCTKEIYTPVCTAKYCLPSFFMSQEDSVTDSNIGADIGKCVNEFKVRAILEGFTDADWDEFQANLEAYKVEFSSAILCISSLLCVIASIPPL